MSTPLLIQRKCAQCGYLVEDPFAMRCPRCHKSLLEISCCRGNCISCSEGGHLAKGGCKPSPQEMIN
ncbi:MAG: hypothetical protein ACOY4I_15005 [Bacillota bacterium]